MDRRSFMAGCAGLALSAKSGRCVRPIRAADKNHLSLRGRRRRRRAVPDPGATSRPAARSQCHRREPHRRRRADRHQGGQGRQSRRHHHSDDHRSDHVPAADDGDGAELQYREGFRAGIATRALRVRRGREPGDRCQGLQAAGGLAQGQPGQGDLWRAEQRHHSAFHRVEAGGSARHENEPRALSRQRADRQRPHWRPSAVRHHHHRGRDPAASRRRRQDIWPSAARHARRSCRTCRP